MRAAALHASITECAAEVVTLGRGTRKGDDGTKLDDANGIGRDDDGTELDCTDDLGNEGCADDGTRVGSAVPIPLLRFPWVPSGRVKSPVFRLVITPLDAS